jgi:hypothetical protein
MILLNANRKTRSNATFIYTILILFALLILADKTHARNPYRKTFFQAYPSAKGTALDDVPSHSGHCGVCHYDFGGSGPKNPYGVAVEATDRKKQAMLDLGVFDSDSDSFTNDTEITDTTTFDNTPTFPGLTPANIGNVISVDVADIQSHLVPLIGGDTTPPSVTVITPNGYETYTANIPTTVEWIAGDASGIAKIDLYVSLDNGVVYKPIAKDLSNAITTYTWFPANRPSSLALLRVVATDNAFNEGWDESDNAFNIQSPPGGIAPTTLRDFDQPGTQPFEAGVLNDPAACAVCHGDYDKNVEPFSNWQGSLMSQASYDPIFRANMVIANQDAPDSGDLCLRCHFPRGWMQGRSVPTDGSAMLPEDHSGVACDLCHRFVDPIDDVENPIEDVAILADLSFPGTWFGNGMYVVDPTGARRGPFLNAATGHPVLVSPFHREAALCGTCHDVSNPAFESDGNGNYVPNTFDAEAVDFSPEVLLPVERTYSEWLNSAYNSPTGIYTPFFGGNKAYVSTCQDCHMADVTGYGCNFGTPPERTDLPLHDLTGGSAWLPTVLSKMYPTDVNDVDITAGGQRARDMLALAADLEVVQEGPNLKVTVTNNTGHKLPTGYPEGRRMWLNIKFYDDTTLIAESGAYNTETGQLAHDAHAKIYEVEPGISDSLAGILGLTSGKSFHFVLNDMVVKDNRIPPQGFTNAAFATFGGTPVDCNYADGQYWDDTYYNIPLEATSVEVNLYYQSTSKEFIEFLRDENTTNSTGQQMYDLWNENDKCPPELMESTQIALTLKTDFDGIDGVNLKDFSIFASYWENDCAVDCGPANLDGINGVDIADLLIFCETWLWGQ